MASHLEYRQKMLNERLSHEKIYYLLFDFNNPFDYDGMQYKRTGNCY